jgi:hypothetical protein
MKKTISKEYLEVAQGDATHLKVEVYYAMGGMNYISGRSEARGIYISVSPVSRTQDEGKYWTEVYKGFSGTKQHVKEMNRFSQKTADTFIVDEAIKNNLIQIVSQKNEIKLAKDLVL